MNDNAIRVISYLVRSHVAWEYYDSRNYPGCPAEIIVDEFLINMVLYC